MDAPTLPIEGLRSDFSQALRRGPLVLSSPTGSGKSTQVPRWCAGAAGDGAADGGRVLVIEPRRVACRSLAQRVATLEGVGLGGEVGYHVRDEKRATARSRIVFATPGIVLRIFDDLSDFNHVIVDEFHERGLEVDLLLALLLDRRRRGLFGGHLIVMSATLDGEKIARHIGGEHLHGEGRIFPVATRYIPGKVLLPEVRGLEERLRAAVAASADLPGDILVFLPGKGEIEACARALGRDAQDLEILPLHGGLSLKEQSRIFERSDRRRVILATNVAETSLTVPGIGVVIDSGLVRQTRYHRDRGFLTLVPIAQDSAEQRAGRAGRTSAGQVFRLWSEAAQLEVRTAPEIYRESLVPLVLSAAACDADPAALPFLDPPKAHALEVAQNELRALGAIDGEGALGERGRRLFGLPLDPFLGRLLVEAEERGSTRLLAHMVDLVSVLSVDRPLPVSGTEDVELGDEILALEDRCDALLVLRALSREGERAPRHPVWREVMKVRGRLRGAFSLADGLGGGVDRQSLAMAILAADRRVVHVARRRGRRISWSNGGTEIEVSKKSALGDAEGVEALAVLSTLALGLGGRDQRILATRVMPLPLSWIVDAGLGRDRLARLELTPDRVVAVIERVYAGKVLARREDIPRGALARQAIAELFLAGRLFKSVRGESEGNLAAMSLAQRLVAVTPEPPYWLLEVTERFPEILPDFETWLDLRLEELGVESGEDIALLDAGDLLFPPPSEILRAELDRAWPRTWAFEGVKYRVDYDLERNEALLIPTQGKAKKLPDAFFLPRFPGLTVRIEFKGARQTLR